MIDEYSNGVRSLRLEKFKDLPVRYGFISRHGGVSAAPFATLNLGGSVGDDPGNVAENRRRAFTALGLEQASAFDVWQVHSIEVVRADQPRGNAEQLKADAIITDQLGVVLFMRFGDCVPVMLFDRKRRVIGMVHAGWQGTVKRIVTHTVAAMVKHYGSRPGDIVAGIGPSICVSHYQVRENVVKAVQGCFETVPEGVLVMRGDAIHLDLWAANHALLEQAGVREIEVAGVCTACHTEDWFSHRAETGKTGRFGALLALEPAGTRSHDG